MTLLRMLTFAPDERTAQLPPIVSGGAKKPEQKNAGPAEETDTSEPITPSARELPKPRRAEAMSSWDELLQTLDLGGVSRMIAEHSVARELSADRVHLILDPAHDTLLGEAQTQMIQRALDGHFGQSVSLHIETGEIEVETPADRRSRLAAERQADAEQMLESSHQVKSLLSEFGGRLDEVQPVDADQSKGSRQSGGTGR